MIYLLIIILLAFAARHMLASIRWLTDKLPKRPTPYENLKGINIAGSSITFKKRYRFRHSSVRRQPCIVASRISEVNLNTWPLMIVVDDKEVLFIHAYWKENLKIFAERNRIPLSSRVDIWALILEPFLDTEFTEEETETTLALLETNGVPRAETVDIRHSIKWRMITFAYLSWEWQYIGHFDYLSFTSISASDYWWSMEIALRNRIQTPFN